MSRIASCLLCLLCLLAASGVSALETNIRFKVFGTAAFLPEHDIQRHLDGTPALDLNGDLRIMFRHNWGAIKLLVDHSTTYLSGDSFTFASAPQAALDQTPVDDQVRFMDLSFNIEEGSRHRSLLLNLNDASSLVQTSVSHEPGDHQRLQSGPVKPLGRAGDEFGGVPLPVTGFTTGAGRECSFGGRITFSKVVT